ncbi:hypothetical protein BC940DRAFT_82429 [Gongronella butleri]|nr:hypothetical protein BC940DRAFT_82429 [Gongronella butleri]
MMVPMVRPPVFERMTMLYEDDEIWLRLQIREFVFRFASVLGMDERWLASMQNVQGDWRMRHLATRVVFRVLCVLQSGHVEPKAVQLAAQRVLHSWAADAGLQTGSSKLGKEKLVMLGEMIDRKGMSHQRWQDVMDLVVANAKANQEKTKKTMTKEPSSSPIPTQHDSDDDENDNGDEENQKEEQLDPLLLKLVQRLTDFDKLRLLQMVLELALCSDALRTDMVQAAKTVRVLEDDLKQEKKQFDMDDLRDKAQRNRWLEQLDQFRLLGMTDKVHQTQIDLDKVDADIVHRSLSMARQQRDVLVAHCRADPRLVPLITPWDNNQYWLFMDLTIAAAQPPSPQTLALQEPHWFQGVVVIGHDPCDLENNKNDQNDAKMDTDRAWMAIHGLPQLQQLDKWLAAHYQTCSSEEQANYKAFKQPLARRMQYIKLLPEL